MTDNPTDAAPRDAHEPGSFHTGYASVAHIDIEAPAHIVWPFVLDMGAWVSDFRFEHICGGHNEVGEIKHLWPDGAEGLRPQSERHPDNATVMKTMSLVPHRMWFGVSPLKKVDGKSTSAANIILLDESNGRTRVTAIRSKEFLCSSDAQANELAARSHAYQPIAQARWTEKYLPRLKALAEEAAVR